MHCDHIELDALYHEPNWIEANLEDFRERADDTHERRAMGV